MLSLQSNKKIGPHSKSIVIELHKPEAGPYLYKSRFQGRSVVGRTGWENPEENFGNSSTTVNSKSSNGGLV